MILNTWVVWDWFKAWVRLVWNRVWDKWDTFCTNILMEDSSMGNGDKMSNTNLYFTCSDCKQKHIIANQRKFDPVPHATVPPVDVQVEPVSRSMDVVRDDEVKRETIRSSIRPKSSKVVTREIHKKR